MILLTKNLVEKAIFALIQIDQFQDKFLKVDCGLV